MPAADRYSPNDGDSCAVDADRFRHGVKRCSAADTEELSSMESLPLAIMSYSAELILSSITLPIVSSELELEDSSPLSTTYKINYVISTRTSKSTSFCRIEFSNDVFCTVSISLARLYITTHHDTLHTILCRQGRQETAVPEVTSHAVAF